MASPTESTLPTRATTTTTMGEEGVIGDEDTSEVTKLFQERLQAWKHACGYLEEYITATEKLQISQAKEYEKVLKTVSNPLREAHHFDQNLGGIAGMFDNIRSNTQGISNSHNETAKALKGQVLPSFERLHAEIKNKNKELTKGAGKQGKVVDKARAVTQKHIELLGQHAASFDSQGGKMTATEDPYVLQRQVMHRLNKQVIEENNNRQDLLAVQGNFSQFEAHVIQTMQQGLEAMMKILTGQQEQTKAMYNDIVGTAQCIPLDYEWQGFIQRNTHILIDPNAPPRSVSNISFPNQGHRATQPLMAGSLERRGKMLRRYATAYYAVTPSKFLHEFKTDDDFGEDPEPEMSLYLPDCVIGAIDGNKFNVKGKDVSKGKVGNAFSMTHELAFKAHTASDAEKWYETIRSCIGTTTNDSPNTPAGSRVSSTNVTTSPTTPDEKGPSPLQTQGITGGDTVESPAVASAPTSETASAVEKKA
ncbi:putative ph domain protein [Lasiodiplodia theobromae]|uniref:Cytoskeletal signaling protein slm1 n=2 Tax=Lasiodiplodia TaxID=66739 RepID=A0A5N5CV44_9PEZI|nr:Ph domain-containing protein [Lasiodiplodia theobromae]KAB2569217.1 Cytoskeletal signaling protein slm1 [Lasiodiplodia theobromae]KAF4541895.1 Ph domain-containing protein [Lasiodiplodia theobromae]KAF9632857.1 putative ph domain protein [Lasiodiplodia theobromae]KAK0654228.1 Cytoskeletal signaling protein slm1 [Lasiodiplodia hormozganensis]